MEFFGLMENKLLLRFPLTYIYWEKIKFAFRASWSSVKAETAGCSASFISSASLSTYNINVVPCTAAAQQAFIIYLLVTIELPASLYLFVTFLYYHCTNFPHFYIGQETNNQVSSFNYL
ncbi:unnamed protein product [Onchocerca flexuosa]|uniref:Ovule protein n=1 Tax=Onchocerca flexuosa TaxID=387005 RepID=A0A183H508_9BILA|nr:unnamed protein product [Onchocerca flexuosa]